ncbi:hypothetical protein CQW23_09445 [Capsicum baccatum]|uniref:Protein kinase domain-containing protein n=1 Tax=Capsicum baccatum TaxID=33114 RepID=A0A2G2WWS8_CAPBA|nr:hypothetical protein CQW23_09445 [Capsicum baccatum]
MNQFSNEITREIGGLKNLAFLSFRHNKLQGAIPYSISNMVGLEFLDLSHNNIFGNIPMSLEKLQNLRYRRGKSAPKQAESLSTITRERISYYELLQATDDLNGSNLVGFGNFGSVYKDVKPSNALLDEDLIAHLSDFGISKLLGEDQGDLYTKSLATFGYIAPDVVMEVVDANLLTSTGNRLKKDLDVVASIMKVALDCCNESPTRRANMKDVVGMLQKIKIHLLAC